MKNIILALLMLLILSLNGADDNKQIASSEAKEVEMKVDVTICQLLMQAAKNNDLMAMQYALENGAPINYQDEQGKTALMYAAIEGNAYSVEFLINSGAKISIKDKFDFTAIDYSKKHKDISKLLSEFSIKITANQ